MKYRKCEICGLRTERKDDKKRYFMARFPLDESRCREWVKVTGNEDLAYVPIEKLHHNKFVCGKHFSVNDFNKIKTRLKKTAVPTICNKAVPLSDEILTGFPCHIHSSILRSHEESTAKIGTKATQGNVKDNVENSKDDQIISNVADDTDIERDDNISDNDVTTEKVSDVAATFTWQRPSEVIKSDDEDNVDYIDTERTDDVTLFNDDISSSKSVHRVTVTNKNVSTKQGDTLSGAETKPHSHKEYKCDVCSGPIQGFRYRCVQCVDYDLCAACESGGAHERHYVLRIPVHRPYAEIETVLQKIRTELVSGTHSILFEDTQMLDSIKEEIKAEEDDPLVVDATSPADPFVEGTDETRSEVMSNVSQSEGEEHEKQGGSEGDNDYKRKKRKCIDSEFEHDYTPRIYKIQTYSKEKRDSYNNTPNIDNEIQKRDESATPQPHGLDKRKVLVRKLGEKYIADENIKILKTIANKTTYKLSDTNIVTQMKLLNPRRTVQPATDSPSTSVPLKHISMRPSDSRSTPSVLKKAQIVIKKLSDSENERLNRRLIINRLGHDKYKVKVVGAASKEAILRDKKKSSHYLQS